MPRDTGRSHPSQDRREALCQGTDLLPGPSRHLLLSAFSSCLISGFSSIRSRKFAPSEASRALRPSFRLASTPLTFIRPWEHRTSQRLLFKNENQGQPETTGHRFGQGSGKTCRKEKRCLSKDFSDGGGGRVKAGSGFCDGGSRQAQHVEDTTPAAGNTHTTGTPP